MAKYFFDITDGTVVVDISGLDLPDLDAVRNHAIGMGGSYIALLTGFYVDNGPFLPIWDRLPHITYWFLPSFVGVPLIWLALRRFSRPRASGGSSRRPLEPSLADDTHT